jgi:hypothetical protein
MARSFVIIGLLFLILGACTQRMVCPAYQSAFIYDQDELRKKFSYFEADSSPKIYTASKNKYLVAEPVSYHHKLRSMRTIPMKRVMVQVPDSLSGKVDSVLMADVNRATQSVIDSTVIIDVPKDSLAEGEGDSTYVISKDREMRLLKYNMPDSLEYDSATQRYMPQKPRYYVKEVRYQMEQDNYMWYLRDAIVLPDVRIAKMQQENAGKGGDDKKAPKEKRGLKGFFRNLFKKKSKDEVDSTALQKPQEEEFDFIDEADTTSRAEVPQPGQETKTKEKKIKKKKDKSSRKKEQPVDDKVEPKPADKKDKKKEDEDDGF